MRLMYYILFFIFVSISKSLFAQKSNKFPQKTDQLHVKVEMFNQLMLANNWNEGTFMHSIIFPPAGLSNSPVIGRYADSMDETTNMLVAYSHKYFINKNPEDRDMANELFEGILKTEIVTGVPGLFARGFYKTKEPLWHESLWYNEWHWSTSMPGYRWMGDFSADKFTSLCYAAGIYWEFCADEEYKQKVAELMDRFMGRIVDNNFKITDLDGKMTLWGNYCPDLPHQPLNSLEILMGLKVTHRITGKERYNAAYHMLIDRYHYDDHQINSKILFPEKWRNPWDDCHAAKSLYMLMRYEDDRSLMIKYRMNLNRHWFDWKDRDFSFENDALFILTYQILTGENVMTPKRIEGIKAMWGYDRQMMEFKIPQEDGSFKIVKSEEDRSAASMIRNYWFGRHYNLIDSKW